jgi:DegV family protein with EDD domain
MIKIVIDSTSYLPEDLLRQYDIRVVPLNVHFGAERVFREGVDLTPAQFYKMLAESPVLPTTSQPSPGQFHDVFADLTGAGHQVVCIVISSGLSGTYRSAVDAQRMLPDADIVVIDSYSVAGGLGLMALTAAQMASAGHAMEEIVARLEQMKQDTRVYFVVDTLEYLQKGGRIGTAAALIGTLLQVKPILVIHEGIVQPLDKVRNKRKALRRLLEVFESQATPDQPVMCMLMHAQAADEANSLASEVQKHLRCEQIITVEVGAVVGTHAGPGVVGGAICPVAWPVNVGSIIEDQQRARLASLGA